MNKPKYRGAVSEMGVGKERFGRFLNGPSKTIKYSKMQNIDESQEGQKEEDTTKMVLLPTVENLSKL